MAIYVLNKPHYLVFNACVFRRLLACMHACMADMLEGKELVIYMVLRMYFILSAV